MNFDGTLNLRKEDIKELKEITGLSESEAEEVVDETIHLAIKFKICQRKQMIRDYPGEGLEELTAETLMAEDPHLMREDDEEFTPEEYQKLISLCEADLAGTSVSKRSILDFDKDPDLRWDNDIVIYIGDMKRRTQKQIRRAVAAYKAKVPCLTWKEVGKRACKASDNCMYFTPDSRRNPDPRLPHTQNEEGRDEFVRINWRNIEKANQNQYAPVEAEEFTDPTMIYDYGSIMHYDDETFGKEGAGPTMVATDSGEQDYMGKATTLSEDDVALLESAYC